MKKPARYTASARFYDLISAEWPVYRAGRDAAMELLDVQPGESVLDIGCGTGLNFPLLRSRIGDGGAITGVDSSAQMLEQARRRGPDGRLALIEADAASLTPSALGPHAPFDAVIATYALSLMPTWPDVLESMIDATRPGGRVCIVDMQRPVGRAAAWTPVAELACKLGGSDIDAHPWTALESSLLDVRSASARGGHIQIRVGIVPGDVEEGVA